MTLFSYISASCFGNYGTLTTSGCRDLRRNRMAATQRPPAIAGGTTGHLAIPLIQGLGLNEPVPCRSPIGHTRKQITIITNSYYRKITNGSSAGQPRKPISPAAVFVNHIITIQAQPGHKAHAATPATIPSRAGIDNRPSQAPQRYADRSRGGHRVLAPGHCVAVPACRWG